VSLVLFSKRLSDRDADGPAAFAEETGVDGDDRCVRRTEEPK